MTNWHCSIHCYTLQHTSVVKQSVTQQGGKSERLRGEREGDKAEGISRGCQGEFIVTPTLLGHTP